MVKSWRNLSNGRQCQKKNYSVRKNPVSSVTQKPWPFLGVSVILFYCDKLSYRIGHNLLQLILNLLLTCICIIHIVYIMTAKHIQHVWIRSKRKSRELMQRGEKGRKIRKKINITKLLSCWLGVHNLFVCLIKKKNFLNNFRISLISICIITKQ